MHKEVFHMILGDVLLCDPDELRELAGKIGSLAQQNDDCAYTVAKAVHKIANLRGFIDYVFGGDKT